MLSTSRHPGRDSAPADLLAQPLYAAQRTGSGQSVPARGRPRVVGVLREMLVLNGLKRVLDVVLNGFFYFILGIVAASPENDHKLKWDMFQLQQLEGIAGMLTKLFRQECQMIVFKYETLR